MQDRRVNLWQQSLSKIQIGDTRYILQGEPQRGATCFVYPAMKLEKTGEKVYEHRILLKEFYPLLSMNRGIHRREDGFLEMADYIVDSEEYKLALRRFQNAYGVILELRNGDKGAEYLPVPTRLLEANGTWYLEEAYDSGTPLSEAFSRHEVSFVYFLDFWDTFEKCARAVDRLHQRGYYHLDLKPQNVSRTKEGNIKLFDADTFLKREDLEKSPTLYLSEGYSAPELRMAAEMPEDAPYLIGPWTDIYSLCQIVCWYLYGRPLQEHEVEEELDRLEEVIRERFDNVRGMSSCGLYRLKVFLKKNLSYKTEKRNQKITVGMLEDNEDFILFDECLLSEANKIRKYLDYGLGEPVDNFREVPVPVFDCRKGIVGLERLLTDAERPYIPWWGFAVLTGSDRDKRETIARYYATKHRLGYGNIVEITCNSFENILEKVEVCSWPESVENPYDIKNPHDEPILFLIFDTQEKNVLSKKEAEDLNALLEVPKAQVLIVGKHNRCAKKDFEFSIDVVDHCVDLDLSETVQKEEEQKRDDCIDFDLDEILKLAREDDRYKEWSWKTPFWQGVMTVLLLAVGGLIVWLSGKLADRWISFDAMNEMFVKAPWWQITIAMVIHLLGSGVCMLGISTGLYLVFDLVTPRGPRYFDREYSSQMLAGWATIASLTMPNIFWECSWYWLCQIFGWRHWMLVDKCNVILRGITQMVGICTLILWIYHILWNQRHRWIVLRVAGTVTLILACTYMVFQTLENPWELLLFGLLICAVEYVTFPSTS